MEEAILGGATMVQLREKTLTDSQLLRSAQELKDITDRHGIPLIINDRPDIALKCGADGVHIGQGDGSVQEVRRMLGPDKIIGISAHNPEEAAAAEAAGADYLGIGAVFSTSTKKIPYPYPPMNFAGSAVRSRFRRSPSEVLPTEISLSSEIRESTASLSSPPFSLRKTPGPRQKTLRIPLLCGYRDLLFGRLPQTYRQRGDL